MTKGSGKGIKLIRGAVWSCEGVYSPGARIMDRRNRFFENHGGKWENTNLSMFLTTFYFFCIGLYVLGPFYSVR